MITRAQRLQNRAIYLCGIFVMSCVGAAVMIVTSWLAGVGQ